MNADGGGGKLLAQGETPAFSPDGRRIAFERDFRIYVMNADGSGQQPLSSGDPLDYEPTFSPDGTKIAFERRIASQQDLWVMNADGSGQASLVADDVLDEGEPSWQPIAPAAAPSNEFSFGKLKRNTRKGTAKLTVEVPGPGELELAKTGKLKGAAKRAEAAGGVRLKVAPRGKARRKLSQAGAAKPRVRVKVTATVTYAPAGGVPNTESKKLTLIRRR
jgi:hypothetical protein